MIARLPKQNAPKPTALPLFDAQRVIGIAILAMVLSFAGAVAGIEASWAAQVELSPIPISFPIQSAEVAAYFEQVAGPQDIATLAPADLNLLPQDTTGLKMVGFRSYADGQRDLDGLVGSIDGVMYNPEHWELTPDDEQQNLDVMVRQFAQLAHDRGLEFMFAPDRRYAEQYLAEVAPYVDSVLLQGQRLQDSPEAFAAWIRPMIATARTANPEIEIWVQVGATLGPASQMMAAIQTVVDDIDGIAIWSMPRSLNVLQEFVTLLRESGATAPGTSSDPVASPRATATPSPSRSAPSATSANVTAAPTARSATPSPGSAPTATSTPRPTIAPTGESGSPLATQTPEVARSPAVETATGSSIGTTPTARTAAVGVNSPASAWFERIALVVAGMLLGVFLGFWLGRRQGHGPTQ